MEKGDKCMRDEAVYLNESGILVNDQNITLGQEAIHGDGLTLHCSPKCKFKNSFLTILFLFYLDENILDWRGALAIQKFSCSLIA